MIKQLKDLFKINDEPMDMSRRKFIKTSAALAALTFAAVNVPKVLLDEREKTFADWAANGVIEGQTFYLDEPIVIAIDNLTILNCRFIARRPMHTMIEIRGRNLRMQGCCFDGSAITGAAITIRKNAFEKDYTNTLQSSFDTLSPSRKHQTLRLTAGTYRVESSIIIPSSIKITGKS